MKIKCRAAAPAAIKRIRLLIFLRQRGLHKGSGRPQQRRDPHPEHGPCTTHGNRRHHANEVAHTHPGSGGDHQRLERRKAALLPLLFLADSVQHIPEQPHRKQPGAQCEIDARRKQQDDHKGEVERHPAQRQSEQISPQKIVNALNQSNQHQVFLLWLCYIETQRFYYNTSLQVCKLISVKFRTRKCFICKTAPLHFSGNSPRAAAALFFLFSSQSTMFPSACSASHLPDWPLPSPPL